MPPTPRRSTSLLTISLEGPPRAYSPGDTLIGHVTRLQHIVGSQGVVTIELSGRAKTRIEIHTGQSRKVKRSRFALIDERETRQRIHHGPIHIPQGGGQPLVVPFVMTIPTHVSRRSLLGPSDTSFLPLDAESVARQTLPSSVLAPSRHTNIQGFIEYFLEAKINIKGQDEAIATLPITIWNYSDGPPITDFQPRLSRHLCTVTSQRLEPGMEGTELTRKDKMKKFFGTQSVPRYAFQLEVGVPSVIQLDNPNPIPFTLRAVPDWKFVTESIQGVEQKIVLRNLYLTLDSMTQARADGNFSPYEKSTDVGVYIPTDRAFNAFALRREDVHVPSSDDLPALDVGRELNIRITHHGATGNWKPLPAERPTNVRPTMTTYNFKITHALKWEAKLVIAGEEVKAKGVQPVHILQSAEAHQNEPAYTAPPPEEDLPLSDAWIQPPPGEHEALPTFNEVQREDRRRRESRAVETAMRETGQV